MSTEPIHTVAMVTRELNSYRLGFLDAARSALRRDGIELRLYVGGATTDDRAKDDAAELEWAQALPTREIRLGGRDLWWQPAVRIARDSSLIITEQASKQLLNVPLSLLQRTGRVRHCLWGHGKNFQESIEGGSGERLKAWFTRPAHWFFSYTELSTSALIEAGFPSERITTFNNSTDVASIREIRQRIVSVGENRWLDELRLGSGPVVGYLGSLYPPKRIEFLLEALDQLRARVPNVEVIVIGGGSEQHFVEEHAATRPWLHWVGPQYGDARIGFALGCQLLLMPGMVGLNVVDGFAMGLPTVTTAIDFHSPEIAYVDHGVNGWICPETTTPFEYAAAVGGLLHDQERLDRLQDGANATGNALGTEKMAELFAAGVRAAIDAPARKNR